MLKKISIGAIALALSSSYVFANAVPYVGVALGAAQSNAQLTNPTSSTYFSAPGVQGGVFAGYGGVIYKKFYLAGEVFFNDSNARSSTKTIDTMGDTAQFLSTYSYGIAMLPGLLIAPKAVVYGRVGFLRTHYQLNPTAETGLKTCNSTPNGGEIGLGLHFQLTQQLDVRGEYNYASYRKFVWLGNNVSVSENMFMGEVIYRLI